VCLSDGADLERLFPVNYFGLVHVNAQADGKHGGGVSDGGHKLGSRGKFLLGDEPLSQGQH